MEAVRRLRVVCMAVALAFAPGCCLVPRPEAAADEVFRNARGEAVEVPWDWAEEEAAW